MVSHRIILIYTAKGYKQFLRPRANINRIIIIFLIDNNEKIALHSTVVVVSRRRDYYSLFSFALISSLTSSPLAVKILPE